MMPVKTTKTTKRKATKTVKAKSLRKPSVKVPKPRKPPTKTDSEPKFSTGELKFKEHWELLYPDIDLYHNHKFLKNRKFKFDFAHLPQKIAIEINGGNWIGGRHSNALALNSEYEKLNLAVVNGWRVFVLSPEMITDEWLEAIAQAIQTK